MRHLFVVRDLEDGWDWNDLLEVDEMAEEYCTTVLEIPSEHIEKVAVKGDGLSIKLEKNRAYLYDDWYTNLSRVCEYYAKCA